MSHFGVYGGTCKCSQQGGSHVLHAGMLGHGPPFQISGWRVCDQFFVNLCQWVISFPMLFNNISNMFSVFYMLFEWCHVFPLLFQTFYLVLVNVCQCLHDDVFPMISIDVQLSSKRFFNDDSMILQACSRHFQCLSMRSLLFPIHFQCISNLF